MGRIEESDKRLICQGMPADFFTMLASTIFIDDVSGKSFINTSCYEVDCENMTAAITCANVPTDPEAFVVAHAFETDACGFLALKIRACEESAPQ